ncbi:MAG: hypothetical protein WBA74_21150 [Cyclobacteriaceae bacterium]
MDASVYFENGTIVDHMEERTINDPHVSLTCSSTGYAILLNLSSADAVSYATSNGSHIGYSSVREYMLSDADYQSITMNPFPSGAYMPFNANISETELRQGYTHATYINDVPQRNNLFYYKPYHLEEWVNTYNYPYGPAPELSYKNGKILTSSVYEKSGDGFLEKSRSVNYYNSRILGEPVNGLVAKPIVQSNCYSCLVETNFGIRSYAYDTRFHYLDKTVNSRFENGKELTQTVRHYYDTINFDHYMPVGSRTTDSEGDIIESFMVRDLDYPSLITARENRNNGEVLIAEELTYNNNGMGFLPETFSQRNRKTGLFKTELTYSYTNKYNVRSITTAQGGKKSFVWGASGARLLAELVNVDENRLVSLLQSVGVNESWFISVANSGQYTNKLKAVQALLNPMEKIRIYEYEQPYGPTRIIDENGYQTTFGYDEYGRLQWTKDNEGNVLSYNTYGYINEEN